MFVEMTTADKLNLVVWSCILFSLLILLLSALSWHRKKRLSLFNKAALLIVFLGMAALADAYWIEPNWLETERVVIQDPELADVLEGIRVVQISDIHLRAPRLSRFERELIAQVNALDPDLLFITGDFFRNGGKDELAAEVRALTELIRSFKAKAGIFGVLGNYDGPLTSDPANMKEFRAAGIDILVNENRAVSLPNHKTLHLAGLYDYWCKRPKSAAFREIPPGAPVVVLSHTPDNFSEAARAGANLVLSGHMHGGQIGIPFLVRHSRSASKSAYVRGLFFAGNTKMYVNRGIGTTRIPIRFLNRPEITLFDFRK